MIAIRVADSSDRFLNSATSGEEVARQVLSLWSTERVCLDLSTVEFMTASFANALFFNLLNACENKIDRFDEHVVIQGASDAVQESIEMSLRRHTAEGVRLTRYLDARSLSRSFGEAATVECVAHNAGR